MRILYIDIDTLRADHLGCYGYHRNTSPNIDKIANEGTKFTQCYASDTPCLPSRASLFTGRFGIHTGIVGHGGTAADIRLTGEERGFSDKIANKGWISLLRRAGFYTVSVSPYLERHSAFWFASGWNEMYNPGKGGMEIADDVLPFAEKWLNDNGKQKNNWFLHLNIWDPHTPYRTPLSFGNPFENDPPPSWLTQEIITKQRQSYGPHSATEPWGYDTMKVPKELLKDFPIGEVEEIRNIKDYKIWIDGYDTAVRYADEFVGKILGILNELGIYDDTLIMISADHGESLGELNVYGDHATADNFVNRVPMVIKWPGKENNWNNKYDNFIYATDMAATIVESVGQKVPEIWDGKSFYKQIDNGKNFGRNFLVISQNAWSCQRTIRFKNWMLLRTYHTGLKNFPEIMLFDIEKDVHMTENLADEKPDVVGRGMNLLDQWHKEMMKSSTSEIDPMWTVIKEGGPSHTRDNLKEYLIRLLKTDREKMVKKILDRQEAYNEYTTLEEVKEILKFRPKLSVDSKLGEILCDPEGKKVISKNFGTLLLRPQFAPAMNFSLKQLAGFIPNILNPKKLAEINRDLVENA
ncbi:MAG: sulfatase-like hydrolase/transferase [Promethearchaeota archaeon]